ncbi:MAG TPA: sulfate permease [Chloroflexi bacterium]|nr:sulfate permease [Chloroflexota bacterium]
MSVYPKQETVPPLLVGFKNIPAYFLQPLRLWRTYDRSNLRLDLIAGLTVAVVLLPQAIAYAFIAELPAQVGLYTAIVAAVIGALWGSSNHLQTGPTNAISLLVLSTLLASAAPGTPEFLVLTGMVAVMVGVFQLFMGLARLGMLVNFVSHSVIVGFSSGAGVLIAIKQLRPLLGLEFSSHNLIETIHGVVTHLPETHPPTAILGLGTVLLLALLRRFAPKLPGPLIGMVTAAAVIGLLKLDQQGVEVIGELPRGLPPLAKLPLFDFELYAELSAGALAIAAIGLVEAMSIARSIASQTGQRLDSNQEFVGQGLANIVAGLFSGYPCSGSFTRSAVNFKSGARTPLSSIFSGVFVLIAMFALASLAAFVPRAALAGVLMVIAYGMIDRKEIRRIWQGARPDALIMLVTFLGTLFLHLEFAVLTGIMLSFAVYIMKTSVPQVVPVLPDDDFKHFAYQPDKPSCPQLGNVDILGDLYFGAVSHIEHAIGQLMATHPDQRFLNIRMRSVNQCDFSGIHALESIVRAYRERGGDVFMVRVNAPVLALMKTTNFYKYLGADHFLSEDQAITHVFYNVLDPAVCIYECEVRAFKECQNLPRHSYALDIPLHTELPLGEIRYISPQTLWEQLHGNNPPFIIDVREPREFKRRRIPQAELKPLPTLVSETINLVSGRQVVCVCRGGRRSARAAYILQQNGSKKVLALKGGMLAWEAAGFLTAVET